MNSRDGRGPIAIAAIALVVFTLAAFLPVVRNGFISLDDPLYVTANPHVTAGLSVDGFRWALGTFHTGNWHPLTWLSHMADVTIFGLDPQGHHLVGLLLHVLNAVLFFFVLVAMTGGVWGSAAAAALFAVHPMRAESVAWAAERKDLLSSFFLIVAMGAYLRALRRPGCGRRAVVFLLFALGLASKPMVISLPVILLLLDFWPLGRWRPEPGGAAKLRALGGLVAEKWPLVVLSMASALITLVSQKASDTITSLDTLPLSYRLAHAVSIYGFYLKKTIAPVGLCLLYPHPGRGIPTWWVPLAAALVITAVCYFVIGHARRLPFLMTGCLWFLLALVPVIGLVQAGVQSAADRYTYLPHMGFFMAVVWSAGFLGRRGRLWAGCALMVFLAGWTWQANRQARYWRDSQTVYRHALSVTTDNWLIHNNLGGELLLQGDDEAAGREFAAALDANPRYAEAHFNMGLLLERQDRLVEAAEHYRAALVAAPEWSAVRARLDVIIHYLQVRGRLSSEREEGNEMTTLYALSTCPWCRKTKQFMAERGVDCRIVDVDLLDGEELEKALQEVDRLVPNRSFPVVVIGDRVIQGFKPDQIGEALDHESA